MAVRGTGFVSVGGRASQWRLVVVIFMFVVVSMLVIPAIASGPSPGDLDADFGDAGSVIADFGGADLATSVSVDDQGRIVVAGIAVDAVTNATSLAFVRLLPDGTPDPSFGTGGFISHDVGTGEWVSEIVHSDDGKIIAAGLVQDGSSGSPGRFLLVRLNGDGSLDSSFGTNGVSTTDFGSRQWATAIVLQSDGKIIAGGYDVLARFDNDGSLDSTFGLDGRAQLSWANVGITAVVVQGDGQIVVGGNSASGFAVSRVDSTGVVDTGFGTGGVSITYPGTNAALRDLALQPDGKVLAGGDARSSTYNTDFAVVRLDLDGSLDTTFGDGGTILTDFGVGDFGAGVAVQADGKIVTGGTSAAAFTGSSDIAVVRYMPDGSLDPNFGTNGKVISHLGKLEFPNDLILQADGKILLAGTSTSTPGRNDANFQVVRYIAVVDTAAPLVIGVPDRAPNANGWYDAPVVIDWQSSDDSGIATDPANTLATTAGTSVTYTSDPSCDQSGNCATGSLTLSIDLSDPTITGTLSPAPNDSGWNNAPVTVAFTCADTVSGVASCTPLVALSSDGASQTVIGTAVDLADRTSAVTLEEINIDQTPPTIDSAALSVNPRAVAEPSMLTVTGLDNLSGVVDAEYFLDTDPGAGSATSLTSAGGTFVADLDDSLPAGEYSLGVRVRDAAGNWSEPTTQSLVVYDPDAGFVTGGGWFNSPTGALRTEPDATGKTTFGFVAKYHKGKTSPDGQTKLKFKDGDLTFSATSFDWLIVSGGNAARFQATGTINGEGEYEFRLWAYDEPDKIQIKIWTEDENGNEMVVYDTGDPFEIIGGSITVHANN